MPRFVARETSDIRATVKDEQWFSLPVELPSEEGAGESDAGERSAYISTKRESSIISKQWAEKLGASRQEDTVFIAIRQQGNEKVHRIEIPIVVYYAERGKGDRFLQIGLSDLDCFELELCQHADDPTKPDLLKLTVMENSPFQCDEEDLPWEVVPEFVPV
jgi:hypothetical protein